MPSVPPSRSPAAEAGPDPSPRQRRRLPGATLALVGLLLVVGTMWGGFMLIGTLSETYPELTPALVAGALSGLIVLAIFGMRAADAPPPVPEKRADPEDGSDGGGGSRRPDPTPRPPTPAPPGPDPQPGAPWDEFDAVRSGWERVPAGRS